MRLARYRSPRDRAPHVGIVAGDLVTPIGPGAGQAGQDLLLTTAMAALTPTPPNPRSELAVSAQERPRVRVVGADLGGSVGEPERLAEVQLLAPVPVPPSIRDFYAFEAHVATARRSRGLEMEPDWYELPVFYFTNPAAVLGPDEAVVIPPGTSELDYELEVAAVIGVECADVDPACWREVVAGFTVMNDWSARDLQRREMALGLGPAKGKDFATSLGPVLVTPDELVGEDGVPRAVMTASVNGQEWSRGDLGDLHHGWGVLIAHASRATRLRPGDVIGSGTVGTGCILELGLVHGRDRYPYLVAGDEVTLEVAGIGRLTTPVTDRPPFRTRTDGEGAPA